MAYLVPAYFTGVNEAGQHWNKRLLLELAVEEVLSTKPRANFSANVMLDATEAGSFLPEVF